MGDRYPGEEAMARMADGGGGGGGVDLGDGPGGRLFAREDDETTIMKTLANSSSMGTYGGGGGGSLEEHHQNHPWGIFFTVLGTVLLDFDADSCQSPSRAYLLDVTVPGTAKLWY